ncbi:glycosyl transferase family group 2-domain-containing protein [Aspergillus coremiiformis]|uniref:Glycosyl transferase family group 2-domain-containing protein n=1 Tax=Aspergillus coremiiformis TaxID=138285 RepID=A0A5N6YW44_9EURO|nr:glycosyl transferase family group 2-domain-containing protein [Aspergillus coremiiformis]
MIVQWASRCLPGFGVIALLILLLLTSDIASWPWEELDPDLGDAPEGKSHPLSIAQKIFIVYTILIHVNMLGFTVRLAYVLLRIPRETKRALQRRLTWSYSPSNGHFFDSPIEATQQVPDPLAFKVDFMTVDEVDEPEVIHAIILPNYKEENNTLRTTLNVLASHPRARSQYEVYLAMEQKEIGAFEKAETLSSTYEKSFRCIHSTFHPAGLPGEIAGKSSNVAFAAQHIAQVHRAALISGACNVIVTVMDADTHLWQDYFTEIRRLHYTYVEEAERTLYCCPIIFDRNAHEVPILVRCADLLWSFAGLSTMYPGSTVSIPTSVYSLPLSLVERVGGWDSDPTAIGEDMHMMLKCYFETAGKVVTRVIHIPASQCNVASDTGRGWRRSLDTCFARYRQALRHMWGALDSGFAARRTMRYFRRCLFLQPRHMLLFHLLFEAHFLPCQLIILIIFSAAYEHLIPPTQLHPDMAWTLRVTDILRTSSFIGMNVCLALYERWHALCLHMRKKDMLDANLTDTGFSRRIWWRWSFLLERLCFPIAGTVFGAVPTFQALFSHFWTERLEYRVSKKPAFVTEDIDIA